MKIGGIIQTAILLLLLAAAASCEVSKEYFHRTFHSTQKKKSDSASVRFMQSDTISSSYNKEETVLIPKIEKENLDTVQVTVENKPPVMSQTNTGIRMKRKRTGSL